MCVRVPVWGGQKVLVMKFGVGDDGGGGGRRCGWRSAWWALGGCVTVGWWRVVAGAGGAGGGDGRVRVGEMEIRFRWSAS